jgi:hypothetical protein
VETARTEFFDTRTSGQAEIWGALRLVCSLVAEGDLGGAQAILDAAGGTCPTGRLWGRGGGVFDERGERYVVPGWVIGWPGALRVGGEGEMMAVQAEGAGEMTEEDDGAAADEDGDGDDEVGILSRKEKGKERDPGPVGTEIKLKARLSSNGKDFVVRVGEFDLISTVIRRIRDAADVSVTVPYNQMKANEYRFHMMSESDWSILAECSQMMNL